MAETRCAACEKVLDVEPPKCPYCGAGQPEGGARAASPWAWRAAAVGLGVCAGLALGELASRPAVQPPRLIGSLGEGPAPASVSTAREEFRARAAAAVEAVKREGRYRYVRVEDAEVDGAKLAGSRVAVAGLGNWLDLTAAPPRFALCTGWGSGASLPVDAGALSDEARKDLLKNNFPPSFFLVRGVLRRGVAGSVPGAAADYTLAAESIQDLGRAPDSGTKPFTDYVP